MINLEKELLNIIKEISQEKSYSYAKSLLVKNLNDIFPNVLFSWNNSSELSECYRLPGVGVITYIDSTDITPEINRALEDLFSICSALLCSYENIIGNTDIDRDITYNALFNRAPFAIAYHKCCYNKNGEPKDFLYIDVNEKFIELTGFNPKGLLLSEVVEEYNSNSFSWFSIISEVVKDGKDLRFQKKIDRLGGWFDILVFEYKKDHVVVELIDISEQKRVEDLLRNERDKIQKFLDTVETIIIALDPNGNIVQVNRKGCEVLGQTESMLLGKSWFDTCLLPDGRENSRVNFLRVMKRESNFNEYHLNKVVRKDGTIRDVAWHHALLLDSEGSVIGSLSAGQDITEKKKAEDALIESQKALKNSEEKLLQSKKLEAVGLLAGGIAHDFNNMLGGIIGSAQLLKKSIPDVEKNSKYLQIITDTVIRASDLTKKLLTFAKNQPTNSEVLDIHKTILETITLLENSINSHILIKTDFKSDSSMIFGEISQIQNIFINLIINASQAMTKGGEINFSTKKITLSMADCSNSVFNNVPGENIHIEVRDSGTGIKKEELDHIFDPFYTTKEQGEGSGLGLSVVYGSIKQHRGSISVYSEEDRGTVFNIILPLTKSLPVKKDISNKLHNGSGKILLIDDDELLLEIGKGLINTFGYDVVVAENGIVAVDLFNREWDTIDLIIMDMVMPEMNGVDCFYKLRELKPDIPVIITSGFTDNDDIVELLNNGASGFIKKPYTELEINIAIRDALKKE